MNDLHTVNRLNRRNSYADMITGIFNLTLAIGGVALCLAGHPVIGVPMVLVALV